MRFWEIDERALGDDQGLELAEDLAPRSRDKAVPNSGDVNQILSPVIPNYDGIQRRERPECSLRSQVLVHYSADTWPTSRSRLPASYRLSLLLATTPSSPWARIALSMSAAGDLEIVSNADSGRLKPQNRFHDFMPLDKWQPREIAIVVNEKIENEVVNA